MDLLCFCSVLCLLCLCARLFIYSEEKIQSVQTLCAIILYDSLNIDKNLTQNKIHVMPYKCEHFQQNVLKIYPFSLSKLNFLVNIKIQIS